MQAIVMQIVVDHDGNHDIKKKEAGDSDSQEFLQVILQSRMGRIRCEATKGMCRSMDTFQLKPKDGCQTDKVTSGEIMFTTLCIAPNHTPF